MEGNITIGPNTHKEEILEIFLSRKIRKKTKQVIILTLIFMMKTKLYFSNYFIQHKMLKNLEFNPINLL